MTTSPGHVVSRSRALPSFSAARYWPTGSAWPAPRVWLRASSAALANSGNHGLAQPRSVAGGRVARVLAERRDLRGHGFHGLPFLLGLLLRIGRPSGLRARHAGERAGLHETAGDLGKLHVLGLGYTGQDPESGVGGNAVPFHQDALGLPDNVPVAKRIVHLVSALRVSEGERRERGQQDRDPLVRVAEGRGLVGVQAERAQAPLIDPERHAEHAALVHPRRLGAELRPALVLAGVLDPEYGLVLGGVDARAVAEPLLEAVKQQGRLAGGGPGNELAAIEYGQAGIPCGTQHCHRRGRDGVKRGLEPGILHVERTGQDLERLRAAARDLHQVLLNAAAQWSCSSRR